MSGTRSSDGGGTGPEHDDLIAATSMREGMVLYDTAGREIWPAQRGLAGLREAAELIESGPRNDLLPARLTGIDHRPGAAALAGQAPAGILAATASLGMLSDWIVAG